MCVNLYLNIYVESVNSGVYMMQDGRELRGRVRTRGKPDQDDQHCRILDKPFRFYGYQVKENMCGCMPVEL